MYYFIALKLFFKHSILVIPQSGKYSTQFTIYIFVRSESLLFLQRALALKTTFILCVLCIIMYIIIDIYIYTCVCVCVGVCVLLTLKTLFKNVIRKNKKNIYNNWAPLHFAKLSKKYSADVLHIFIYIYRYSRIYVCMHMYGI